jgi:NAD+ synthase (glutamine-hydrolysing)
MKIALAQINPTVGDIDHNAALIEKSITRARKAGAHLVVFPELAISGYPPKDLLLEEGFVGRCAQTARQIGESATDGIAVVMGCPLPLEGDGVANALLVYENNTFIDYYDKRLLPTYDVFDEDRYFTPGSRTVVVDLGPSRTRVGLAICEDLWRGEDAGFSSRYRDQSDPIAQLADKDIDLLVSPSASPFVLGKGRRHREILIRHARTLGAHVASLNTLGGNDELIFDGHSTVHAPDGSLVAAAAGFEGDLLVCDLSASANGTSGTSGTPAPREKGALADPRIKASEEELLFAALRLGVHDYLAKTGFRSAIVGLSGGIDSAVTAAIAAAALGPSGVLGVAMPGPFSSGHSVSDAEDLAARLGITLTTMPVVQASEAMRGAIDPVLHQLKQTGLGEKLPDVANENLQARVRGSALMTLSNRTGSIVLTTGNKSELAVGYCTLYGDMNGGLAVLADVTKQQVYALSRWMNAHFAACGFASPPIPQSTIDKPPSAELAPDQLDQDTLPPYEVLDEIIRRRVELKQSPTTIERETGFDRSTIDRITHLIRTNEYKRRQMTTGLKVTSVAFGFGRRMPIAQGWRGC